jgi:alkyl hydroperoxide reductase subunit AhpF
MIVLSADASAAVRDALAALELEVPVHLELGPAATPVTLLAAGGGELDPGAITRDVVEAVCGLSERVTLTVTEHAGPGPWPRTTIGPGLTYLGMPAGYELTTLVHGIVEAGRATPALSGASQERLATLERDVSLAVYVTPT